MSSKVEAPGMRDSAVSGSSSSAAWDPYEVWLNRVKKPRDETMEIKALKVASPSLGETGRFRALDPSLFPR